MIKLCYKQACYVCNKTLAENTQYTCNRLLRQRGKGKEDSNVSMWLEKKAKLI